MKITGRILQILGFLAILISLIGLYNSSRELGNIANFKIWRISAVFSIICYVIGRVVLFIADRR
ncbi:MAG: hypothetical protein ABIA63_01615 [bacterium]